MGRVVSCAAFLSSFPLKQNGFDLCLFFSSLVPVLRGAVTLQ